MPRYFLGEFERAVLVALIRLGDDAYGVAIRRHLVNRLHREIAIGAIYTTLQRLEDKGLVSSFMGDPTPQRGGRAKRFFRIEAAGLEALERNHRAGLALPFDPKLARSKC